MVATMLLLERRKFKAGSHYTKCHRTSSILSLWRAEPGPHLRNNDLSAESIPVTHGDRMLNFTEKGSTEESFLLDRIIENWPWVSRIPREMSGRKEQR